MEYLPAVATDDVATADEIRTRLASLPVVDREALLLQAGYGYSLKEIAEIMDTTPAAVGNRVYRARQRLLQQDVDATKREVQA